jgi:hypothetical protein
VGLYRSHPSGVLQRLGIPKSTTLGRHFAAVAHLEAASIQAFLRLREELALQAPGSPSRTRP